jgi:hypothetical protein
MYIATLSIITHDIPKSVVLLLMKKVRERPPMNHPNYQDLDVFKLDQPYVVNEEITLLRGLYEISVIANYIKIHSLVYNATQPHDFLLNTTEFSQIPFEFVMSNLHI